MGDLKLFGEVGINTSRLERDIKSINSSIEKSNTKIKDYGKTFDDVSKKISANSNGFKYLGKLVSKEQIKEGNDLTNVIFKIINSKKQLVTINKKIEQMEKEGVSTNVVSGTSTKRLKNYELEGKAHKDLQSGLLKTLALRERERRELEKKQAISVNKNQVSEYKDRINLENQWLKAQDAHLTKVHQEAIGVNDLRVKQEALNEKKREQLRIEAELRQSKDWDSKFKESIKDLTAKNTIAQKMGTYYKALEISSGKQLEIEKKLTAEKEKQSGSYWQGRFKESIGDMTAQNTELVKMAKYYKDLEKAQAGQAKEQLKALQKQANAQTKEMFGSNVASFGRRAGHLFDYALISGGMFALQKAMRQTITINREFEVGQVNLQRILKATDAEMQRVADMTFKVSKATGQATKEIQAIQNLWIRTGRENLNELEGLTKTTAIGINVAEFQDAEKAVQYLNSAINQMAGGDWTQAEDILDSWAKTADKTAVGSATDLAEVISRSGAQAKQLGMDFHDLNAVTGILAERMAISGDVMGTALKTVFSRFQNTTNIKKLQEFGIQVTKVGKDGTKSFRDFTDVMDDLNAKFKDLSAKDATVEIAQIEEILGGTRMRAIIGNLIGGWDRYEEIVGNSLDSTGFAMEQNAKLAETFDYQLEVLKSTLAELAVSVGEAGLMDVMMGLVQGTKEAVEWFNGLNPTLRDTVLISTELLIGLGLLSTTMKRVTQLGLMDWIKRVAVGIQGLTVNSRDYAKSIEFINNQSNMSTKTKTKLIGVLDGSLKGVTLTEEHRKVVTDAQTLSTITLTTATKAWLTGIQLALVAIPILIGVISAYNRKKEESIQRAREAVSAQHDEITELNSLTKKQSELAGQEELNESQKEELLSVQKRIAEMFPTLITGYSDEGDALAENTEAIKEYAKAKREAHIQDLKSQNASFLAQKASMQKELDEMEKQLNSMGTNIDNDNPSIVTASGNSYRVSMEEYTRIRDELNADFQAMKSQMASGEAGLKELEYYLKETEIEIFKIELASVKGAQAMQMFKQKMIASGISQEEMNRVFGKTSDAVNGAKVELDEFGNEIDEIKTEMDTATEVFETASDNLDTYRGFLDELNSTEGLSIKSKQDMAVKYKELAPFIENEEELRRRLIEIIGDEETAQADAYTTMLMNNETFFTETVKGNKWLQDQLIKFRGTDLDNAKNLAEAKFSIEQNLIGNLGKVWASYYNAVISGQSGAEAELRFKANVQGDTRAQEVLNAIGEYRNVQAQFQKIADGITTVNFTPSSASLGKGSGSKASKDKTANKGDLPSALQRIMDILDHELKMDIITETEYTDRLEKAFNEYRNQLDESAIWKLEEQIYSLRLSNTKHTEVDYDKLRLDLTMLEKELNVLEKQQSFLDTTDADKSQLLGVYSAQVRNYENQLEELVELNQDYADKLLNVNDKIRTLSPTTIGYQAILEGLVDDQKSLTEALEENELAIWDVKIAMEQAKATMEEIARLHREDYISSIKESRSAEIASYNERIDAISSLEGKIMEIIRKRGELEREELNKTHTEEMELLDDSYKKKTESYKNELDAFKDKINGMISALDEQYDNEDYQKKLSEEQQKALDLQSQIDRRSSDDTLEGRNQTTLLRKQLAEQQQKIVEMQTDRERDTIKKGLQQQIADKEKEVKSKEDDDKEYYDKAKERMTNDHKKASEILDAKYEDYQVYMEARESLEDGYVLDFQGNMVRLEDAYENFENRFGAGMGILGDKIKNDFIRQLELAQQAIRDLDQNSFKDYEDDYSDWDDDKWDDKLEDDGYEAPTVESNRPKEFKDWSDSDYSKYVSNKKKWTDSNNEVEKGQYATQNMILRSKYWGASRIHEDKYTYKDLVGTYDKGGIIPRTGVAMVHKDEFVINKLQQKRLWNLINPTSTVSPTTRVKVPTPSEMTPTQQILVQIDNLLNIEGNVTPETVPAIKAVSVDVADKLKVSLNKSGVFRQVK